MARRKVEVRREEILDAAVAEVAARGFARPRVADVAAALGCSSGLVFYHFETKDRLLAGAFEHAVEGDLARLDAAATGAGTPPDRVRRILRALRPAGRGAGLDAAGRRLGGGAAQPRAADDGPPARPALEGRPGRGDRRGRRRGRVHLRRPGGAAWRLTALLDGLSVQATVTTARSAASGWPSGRALPPRPSSASTPDDLRC